MKPKYWIDDELKKLSPETDYDRMVDLLLNWRESNPFLQHLIYTLGFLRQVADPSIAAIIERGGAGPMVRAVAQRGDETLRFFGTWWRYGAKSEEGRASIARLNAIHSRFPITNEQYLYTLATLVVLPDHVYKLIGAPQRPAYETRALVKFWQAVGEMMNLSHIPQDQQAFERYYDNYELRHFAYSDAGQHCAGHLVADFIERWTPGKEAKGRRLLFSLFDDRLRAVFKFDYPGAVVGKTVRFGFLLNGIRQKWAGDPQKPVYATDSFDRNRKRG